MWLAALVAGAVVAALPSTLGSDTAGLSGSAADYGLGVASDVGLSGDLEDAGVRRGITEAEAQARLGQLAASRAAREPKTVLPTQGRLTTCFCMRWGTMHYGIDLAGPLGTPIHSATDGVVIRAGRASGYGNAVYIQDADGNVHVYGHMRYYDVQAGDLVHAGDQIAKIGNEGQSTGPHLPLPDPPGRDDRPADRPRRVPRRARRHDLTVGGPAVAARAATRRVRTPTGSISAARRPRRRPQPARRPRRRAPRHSA